MNKEKTTNSSSTLNVSQVYKKYVYSMLCEIELMHSFTHEIVPMVLEQREIDYLKHLVECDMQKDELENEKEN